MEQTAKHYGIIRQLEKIAGTINSNLVCQSIGACGTEGWQETFLLEESQTMINEAAKLLQQIDLIKSLNTITQ
jgi:hypothetical protein